MSKINISDRLIYLFPSKQEFSIIGTWWILVTLSNIQSLQRQSSIFGTAAVTENLPRIQIILSMVSFQAKLYMPSTINTQIYLWLCCFGGNWAVRAVHTEMVACGQNKLKLTKLIMHFVCQCISLLFIVLWRYNFGIQTQLKETTPLYIYGVWVETVPCCHQIRVLK